MSTFDSVADLYDAVRPAYPEQLFDELLSLAATPEGGRVLEVGAGTGQATEQLADRGLFVVALEPGPRLAERARSRLAGRSNVSVSTTRFEDWPTEPKAFDLVVSATAFHWIDPKIGYHKAFDCLKPSGWIGLFWHRHIAGQASPKFYRDVQDVYRRWAPHLAESYDLPPLVEATGGEEIDESGLFGEIMLRRYTWQEIYDARRYTDLLRTYSDHMALPEDDREGLLEDIESLINKSFGGRLLLDPATVLYAAPIKR